MDLGKMVDKAKDWAGKNPDKADGYVDKGADAVGQKFGHEQQVDQFGDKAKDYLHGGQEQAPPPEGQGPPPPPPGEEPPRP